MKSPQVCAHNVAMQISLALSVAVGIAIVSCNSVAAKCACTPTPTPTRTPRPNKPLNDLGQGSYRGYVGGLYPNGSNQRPTPHDIAGQAIAAAITPVNAWGTPTPSPAGSIGLLSLGMSNANLEFGGGLQFQAQAFKARAEADNAKDSNVIVVDGTQPGTDAAEWADPTDDVWTNAISKVTAAGLTRKQVEIVWMKHAVIDPTGGFPGSAQSLQALLTTIAQNVLQKFPNCKIAFFSTRTHAFTTTFHNPEPYAYETGFANKWTIEAQINHDPHLKYDPNNGTVVAPYICWGPYFWIDGTNARSDRKIWDWCDIQEDLVHPSACGVLKISDQLLAFFETNPISTPWFLNHTVTGNVPNITETHFDVESNNPYKVKFSATVNDPGGTSLRYMWDFDDGDFDYDITSPVKVFRAPGTYHVHLTVVDNDGNHALATCTVTPP